MPQDDIDQLLSMVSKSREKELVALLRQTHEERDVEVGS